VARGALTAVPARAPRPEADSWWRRCGGICIIALWPWGEEIGGDVRPIRGATNGAQFHCGSWMVRESGLLAAVR